jgi:hypothetical protein
MWGFVDAEMSPVRYSTRSAAKRRHAILNVRQNPCMTLTRIQILHAKTGKIASKTSINSFLKNQIELAIFCFI